MFNRQFIEIIAAILILVVIALIVLFVRGGFSSVTLARGEQSVEGNENTIAFRDGENVVAGSYVRVSKKGENFYSLLLELTHDENTKIDAITLEMSSNDILPIALEASTYAWESLEYHYTEGNSNAILSVPEPGIYGEGTINFEFLLGPYPPEFEPNTVILNISLDLHREGLLLIRQNYEAEGIMQVKLPALSSF